MSPDMQTRGVKVTAPDNLYTVILALSLCVVMVTAAFVAYKCYFQYGTIFKIP